MIPFAVLLLMASSSIVDIVDEVYQIPAEQWKYIELPPTEKPAILHAWYSVESGPPEVRLALMRRADLERLRQGLNHSVIETTPLAATGALQPSILPSIQGAGDLVVVVDNRGEAPSHVRLRVYLDYAIRRGPEVTRLSRERQLTVILLSFATFFGIVTWSARRLLRGIKF
jgi:hypothetical protein